MTITKVIVKIFVTGPSDVQMERDGLDVAVRQINQTDVHGVWLEVFDWRRDGVPSIGPPPEQTVAEQSPEYGIFLGILSHRFADPKEPAALATEKQFRQAAKKWGKQGSPWILFYFNEERLGSDEPEDIEQYLAVNKFRKELQTKGLVGKYPSPRDFSRTVEQHLRQLLHQQFPIQAVKTDLPGITDRDTKPPADYCQRLQGDCQDVGLLGLQDKEGRAVCLNHVYVPLTTPRPHKASNARQDPEETVLRLDREEEKPQLLLELLDWQSLYLSGPAGSGKSTFCRWVTWLACAGGIPQHPVAPPEGCGEVFPESFRNRLPLLVRLRDFWKYLPEEPGGRALSRNDLEKSLEHWVEGTSPGGLAWPCAADHLRRGALLLILDGVDEVPVTVGEEGCQCHPRAMLLSGLIAAAGCWVKPGSRLLVTSRPYGVSADEEKKLGLTTAPIAELARPLGELLVRRWFHILARNPESGRRTAEEMLAHVAERPELEPLTANPMLMTAMCVIYGQGGRLPQDKHQLYDRMFDNVLYNRYAKDPQQIAIVRNRLSVIAHGMHTGDGLGDERRAPQAEATYEEVQRMLQRYRDQSPATEPGYRGALAAREDLLTNSGLLLPRGGKRAGFYHFTFQDFSAAQILLEREVDLAAFFRRRGAVAEWRSTLSFVFGALLDKSTLPDRGIRLLETLIQELSLDDPALAVVVSDCLQILSGRGFGLQAATAEKFVKLCLEAIEQEVSLPDRYELGLALGRLGDPRVVADLRDHGNRQAWVEIPAGNYVFGDDKEPPRIEQAYLLTRYPVTNSQYTLFVDQGGYENESLWSEAGWEWRCKNSINEPESWRNGKWNASNLPVVGVSYWEAEAFCRWAGGQLPSERQWEAAARGPQGHEYPWGNDWEDGICNSSESQLERTSPVGLFRRSCSDPFGLDDMAGNVWEWCADPWEAGSAGRVFRGGCWCFVARFCRAAYRGRLGPGRRFGRLGFRVAAVPQVAQVK